MQNRENLTSVTHAVPMGRAPGEPTVGTSAEWPPCGLLSWCSTRTRMTRTSSSRAQRMERPLASMSASQCTQVSCPPSEPTVAAHPQGQTLKVQSFTKCSSLLGHQQAPTGDSPHTCGVCWKVFHRKWDLVYHHHTHPGEWLFGCYRWGKALVQSVMG